MESGELKEVKAVLKSVVISAPSNVTIASLNQDYKEFEGEFIPFRRLGFNSLENFLRSITDTLVICGRGDNATVHAVLVEKSRHIQKMVTEQKGPRMRFRPRRRNEDIKRYEAELPPRFRNGFNSNTYQNARGSKRTMGQQLLFQTTPNVNASFRSGLKADCRDVSRSMQPIGCYRQASSKPSRIFARALSQLPENKMKTQLSPEAVVSVEKGVRQNKPKTESNPFKSADTLQICKSVKKYENDLKQMKQPLHTCHATNASASLKPREVKFPAENKTEKSNPFKQDTNKASRNTPVEAVEKSVKQNDTKLEKNPFKCDETSHKINRQNKCKQTKCDVATAFTSLEPKKVKFVIENKNEEFKQNPCTQYSKQALLDIEANLRKGTQIERARQLKSELNVMATYRKIAKQTDKMDSNVIDAEIEYEINVNQFKDLLDINDAKLPNLGAAVPEFAADIPVFRLDFPQYTVKFGYKIPSYKMPENVDVGTCTGIFIAEIHNPFKFWFHIYKEEHELDRLMDDIEIFYSSLGPYELRIPNAKCLVPGQVCAAIFKDLWHRAEVVAPLVNNTVKVYFVDYGTVASVSINEIKLLLSCFANLPAQAMRASLSHIKPRGQHWSRAATKYFLATAEEKLLFAKITEIDKENMIYHMILCDTYDDEVVQVNKDLVAKGYALYNDDWQDKKIAENKGRRNHHPREDYPTFSMIESGTYPSFSELIELDQCGIEYEWIHDCVLMNKSSILNYHVNAPDIIRNLPFFLLTSNPFRTDILFELTGVHFSE